MYSLVRTIQDHSGCHNFPQTFAAILPFGCVYIYVRAVNAWQEQKRRNVESLITEHRKEGITMEENDRRNEQEDPTPLTDEELEQFQKKENRKVTIIGDIIDFIVSFFH